MPYPKYKPVDFSCLKHNNPSDEEVLFETESFASPCIPCSTFSSFTDSLSNTGASGTLKKLCGLMKKIRAKNRTIFWHLGDEVLSEGLAPVLNDMMDRGWVSALSITEKFLLQDFETAYSGRILKSTPLSEEALIFLNVAIREGAGKEMVTGECIGSYINSSDFIFKDVSVLNRAFKLNIPVTVHYTAGTPAFNISSVNLQEIHKMGERDFRLFLSVTETLKNKGIVLSIGDNSPVFRLLNDSLMFFRGKGGFKENIKIARFGDIGNPSAFKDIKVLNVKGDINIMIPLFVGMVLNP